MRLMRYAYETPVLPVTTPWCFWQVELPWVWERLLQPDSAVASPAEVSKWACAVCVSFVITAILFVALVARVRVRRNFVAASEAEQHRARARQAAFLKWRSQTIAVVSMTAAVGK